MKIYFTLLFFSITVLSITGQNIPIDFEDPGNGADWTWTTFENDSDPALEIIANPDASGFNTSPTVAKFTALQAGQPFAGCETMHGADIGPFTIDATNSTIRIMVWKSVISDVGIKLVTVSGWSKGELKVANTKINEWEQLTFDFSTVDHEGMTYDQIVVFPDFNDRQSDNVIYFDEIYGDVAIASAITDLKDIDIKLFPNPANNTLTVQSDESIDNYKIYSFTGELVANEKTTGNIISVNIAQLSNGMYLMKTTSKGQTIIKRFIKE
jgi:hypothetical protein